MKHIISQSEAQHIAPTLPNRRDCLTRTAYSLLEVQVAIIILTAGMLRVQSRQMEVAESWCRDGIEYYVLSQSNTWMRIVGVPAELTTNPNASVWEPPVMGEQSYEVELDSLVLDPDTRSGSVSVKLKKIKD